MMSRLLLIILLLSSLSGYSQLVISSNTTVAVDGTLVTNGNIGNASEELFFTANRSSGLLLNGTSDQALLTNTPLTIPNLTIDGGSNKGIFGSILVSEQLNLTEGFVVVSGDVDDNSLILLNGSTVTTDGTSWVSGPLIRQGSGRQLFPLGVAGTYAPLSLDISGTDNTIVGAGAIRNNGTFTLTELPSNVDAASTSWLWPVFSSDLNSVGVTLPVLSEDEALITGDDLLHVVLEADTVQNLSANLGGISGTITNGLPSVSSDLETLNDNPSGEFARIYLLGAERTTIPVIHNIITPNGDNSNDYLIIDAISVYADDNEVIILDRWGTEVYRQQNFTNFDNDTNPYDGSFDFLAAGNYICILKYAGTTTKQVITVLN